MTAVIDYDALLRPRSIAVVGASERPEAWGHWMTRKLSEGDFPWTLHPIHPRAKTILGLPAYPKVSDVPEPIDLVIIAVPAAQVFDIVRDCTAKRVPMGLIITAGFSEARSDGWQHEHDIVTYARAHGMRLVGPNVSGVINLSYDLVAHPTERADLTNTPITFICQGAYAISDLAAREASHHRGFGKFLHTGNEADISVVDFLEFCEDDAETEAICLYIEGLRHARRFLQVARRIAPHKPIVVFKAGLTPDGSRAAASHTGALAGSAEVYRGFFRQAGVVQVPTFELSLNVTHALLEMPPLRQRTLGVTTLGGSWGVMLTDALVQQGLRVPELSETLQQAMRDVGMPERASVRNPVDFGAAMGSIAVEDRVRMVELLLTCDDIGGVVVHGYGGPGWLCGDVPDYLRQRMAEDKAMIRSVQALQETYNKPVMLVTAMTPLESQVVQELAAEGVRFQHRLDDAATVLVALHTYARMHRCAA